MLLKNGYDSYVVWGRGRNAENEREIVMKDDIGIKFHGVYTRLTDRTGFASWRATQKLLKKFEEIKPDIIHLHNIHGYYINIEMLFLYIRKHKIKVIWTLHDCWAFTGHCAYFDMVRCEKWKNGCNKCKQKSTYPASILCDNSKWNWETKKRLFTGLDITIVTPSKWLANFVSKSFLKEYPIKVIYNGIDTNIFRPIYSEEIRKKYSPNGKPIVLGVASEWTERKGLLDFINLSEKNKDIQFVVVGLTAKQIKKLPMGIVGIRRTGNIQELVELYSVADIFLNPTYEDNFPTTNLEALACGTPVITYDTGGGLEAIESGREITKQWIGTVINKMSATTVSYSSVDRIIRDALICTYNSKECVKVAKAFEVHNRLSEYLMLYHL